MSSDTSNPADNSIRPDATRVRKSASPLRIVLLTLAGLVVLAVAWLVREIHLRYQFAYTEGALAKGQNYCTEVSFPIASQRPVEPEIREALPNFRGYATFRDPADQDALYLVWLADDYTSHRNEQMNRFHFRNRTAELVPFDMELVINATREIRWNDGNPVDRWLLVMSDWRRGSLDERGNRMIEAAWAMPRTGSGLAYVQWSPGMKLAYVESSGEIDRFTGATYGEIVRCSTRETLARIALRRFKIDTTAQVITVLYMTDRDLILTFAGNNGVGTAICRFPEESNEDPK